MSSSVKKTFLFFWGHDTAKCGFKACFSNWFPAAFVDANGRQFGAQDRSFCCFSPN